MTAASGRRILAGSGVIAVVAALLLAAGLLTAVWVVLQPFSNPHLSYACSRPGQRALAEREDFVRAHLRDASGFEVATYDCEDTGDAYLTFSTGLAPTAARDAFLSERSCARLADEETGSAGLVCGSGRGAVYLYFGGASESTTTGELQLVN